MDNSGTSRTSTAEANQALIERGYEAFARGDIPTVLQVLAEDIFWHVPGRGPLSRDYRGHSEVLGFFGQFMKLSGGSFEIQVDDILANQDHVVVLCTESAERAGKIWSSPQGHVWPGKGCRA